MKAAVLYGYKDLRIEEVEKPVANEDEITFKVMAYGICPSDGRSYNRKGTLPKKRIPVDPNVPHYKHLKITGSHDFTSHAFSTALKLIAKGIVDVKSLISHRLPLEETKKGFDIVSNQEGLKVIIKPHQERCPHFPQFRSA